MKTWQDLSPEQQHFLKSFLKTSVRDLFRDKYKTETNKGIIDAFGRFADLDALFDQRAALVPDDYPEKANVVAQAEAARARNQAGAFDDATQRMAPAIQAMERLRADLTAAADLLRAEVGPVAGVGFAEASITAIDQARQVVLRPLAEPLPTKAQMDEAQAGLATFEQAVNAAYVEAGALPAALAALEKAKGMATARLAEVAAMDNTPFASTPQSGPLAAAVQKAKDLQTAITAVDQNDAVALRTLAGQLTAWLTLDEATSLVDDATTVIIAKIQAIYDAAEEDIEDALDIDMTSYDGQPETPQLLSTQAKISADKQLVLSTFATRDPVEILKLEPLIETTRSNSITLYDLTIDIDVRIQKETYKTLGASDAHADGIVALLDANDDAGEAVIAILERNKAVLKGQEATRTYIEDKGKEAKQLAAELAALNAEWTPLNNDFKEKLADYNEKKKAFAEEKERVTLLGGDATDEDRAAVKAARLAEQASFQVGLLAQTAKDEKATEYHEKKAEVDIAEKELKAAKAQRAMLDAITFGPLSPLAAHPIPDEMLEDVVKLFGSNTDIAIQTCALAPDAKDQKALAQTALLMAAQCEANFLWQPPVGSDGVVPPEKTMGQENAANYAKHALKQVAFFGAEFAAEAEVAVANGVPHKQDAKMRALTDYSMKNVAASRAIGAAETMIQRTPATDGVPAGIKLDLNSPAFNTMLIEQRHGFDSAFRATVTLTEQMGNLQNFFGDATKGDARRAEAEAILNSVTTVPASPAARSLLSTQMGIPAEDFDDPLKADEIKEKIQVGILKAVTTPIAQGDVGSCFATAPLRKLQNDDPVALMEMYRDIATTGVFNPKHGRPVPAVTNLPPGDEPLARSLEYSIATAAARLQNSRERRHMNATMFGAYDPSEPSLGGLKNEVDADAWRKLEPKLQQAVIGGYTFVYDPTRNAGAVSADGSSSKGVYKMVTVDTKEEVLSQADFVKFIKRKALEAVAAAELGDADRDKVTAYIDEPAFINGIDKLAGSDKPWEMQFGGWGDSAGAVLLPQDDGSKRPENLRGHDVVSEDGSDSTGERAVKVLKAIAGMGGGDMTMVSTGGIHAFNALAPEGEFAKLNDPPGFDANVQAKLVDPGLKIATGKLPKDRAAYLYGKRIDAVVPWAADDAEVDLIKAAFATPPDTDMTPAELEAYISTKLEPWKTATVNRKSNEWTAKQNPLPAPGEIRQKKADLLAAENERQKKAVTTMMAAEMGVPTFVIADSNWGSEADKAMFVIAPDPLTGEPRMWVKWVVRGTMSPMEDKWLNTNWVKDQ